MPVDPITISYVLSSVASVGKILETALSLSKSDRLTELEYDKIQQRAEESAKNSLAAGKLAMRNPSQVASGIVDAIREKMGEIEKNIKQAITDPDFTTEERSRSLTSSTKEYCQNLKYIKNFNGGGLPEDLQSEWEKFGCDRFRLS
jgi:hypothetical protein